MTSKNIKLINSIIRINSDPFTGEIFAEVCQLSFKTKKVTVPIASSQYIYIDSRNPKEKKEFARFLENGHVMYIDCKLTPMSNNPFSTINRKEYDYINDMLSSNNIYFIGPNPKFKKAIKSKKSKTKPFHLHVRRLFLIKYI